MGTGKTIERECEVCGQVFKALVRRLALGWGKTCSKVCANSIRSIPKRRKNPRPYTRLEPGPLKEMVRKKAGNVCEHCRKTEKDNGRRLDVHRIIPDGLGGEYKLENLVALCRSCHAIADRRVLG